MPAEAGTSTAVQSTVGTWIARWTVGAALGQIVFGGTIRLVLAVLMGALLGGLGVWLFQRRRSASGPPTTWPLARPGPHRRSGPANRIRYSPQATASAAHRRRYAASADEVGSSRSAPYRAR